MCYIWCERNIYSSTRNWLFANNCVCIVRAARLPTENCVLRNCSFVAGGSTAEQPRSSIDTRAKNWDGWSRGLGGNICNAWPQNISAHAIGRISGSLLQKATRDNWRCDEFVSNYWGVFFMLRCVFFCSGVFKCLFRCVIFAHICVLIFTQVCYFCSDVFGSGTPMAIRERGFSLTAAWKDRWKP